MKSKISLISLTVTIIAVFGYPMLKHADGYPIDFFFSREFQTFKIKSKLKIMRVTADDAFNDNLYVCKDAFYKDMKEMKDYYLEDSKKINKITVAEYVFKDTVAAAKAYNLAYDYAEHTRRLARIDFRFRCYPALEPQVYYASKEESHVFLYTIYYEFSYSSMQESVDDAIKRDKRILLDDLYKEMVELR